MKINNYYTNESDFTVEKQAQSCTEDTVHD